MKYAQQKANGVYISYHPLDFPEFIVSKAILLTYSSLQLVLPMYIWDIDMITL